MAELDDFAKQTEKLASMAQSGTSVLGAITGAISMAWDAVWTVGIMGAIGWAAYQTEAGKEWIDKGLNWLKSTTMGAGMLEMLGGFMEMLGMENPWKGATRAAVEGMSEEDIAAQFGGDTALAKVVHPIRMQLFDAGITSVEDALDANKLMKLALTLPEEQSIALLNAIKNAKNAQGSALVDSTKLQDTINTILNNPTAIAKLVAERPALVAALSKDILGAEVPAKVLASLNSSIGLSPATYYANLLRTDPEQALAKMTADADGMKALKAFKDVLPDMPDSLLPEAFRGAGKDRLSALANKVLGSEDTRKAIHTLAANGVLQSLQGLAENFDAANAIKAFGDPKLRVALATAQGPEIIKAIGQLMPVQTGGTGIAALVQHKVVNADFSYDYPNLKAFAGLAYAINDDSKVSPAQREMLVGTLQTYLNKGTLELKDPKAVADFFKSPANQTLFANFVNGLDTSPVKGTPTEQAIASMKTPEGMNGMMKVLSSEDSINWIRANKDKLASLENIGGSLVDKALSFDVTGFASDLYKASDAALGSATKGKVGTDPFAGAPAAVVENQDVLKTLGGLLADNTKPSGKPQQLSSLETPADMAAIINKTGATLNGVTTDNAALAPVALAALKHEQLRPAVAIG